MIELPPYPSARILRKMNYLKDQNGIISRYLREKEQWNEHLTNTRQYITGLVRLHKFRVVGILGSGWLLDIPIRELASECEKVYLVDIHHPPQVIHRVNQWSHVQLVRADITGGWIEKAFAWAAEGRKKKAGQWEISADQPVFAFPEKVHSWFSVNILDQLDSLVCDYLLAKKFPDEIIEKVGGHIQSAHIEFLRHNKGFLITDVREKTFRKGKETGVRDLIRVPLPAGTNRKKWTWVFDTEGTYLQAHETHFEVLALRLG